MRSLGRETNEELSFKLQCCLRNVFVLDSNGGSIMPSYSVGYSLRYGVCRAKKNPTWLIAYDESSPKFLLSNTSRP